jgi:hypothetical protein
MFSQLVFVIVNAFVVRFFSLSMFERRLLASVLATVGVNGDLLSKLYSSFYDPLSDVYTGISFRPPAITDLTNDEDLSATTCMSFAQLLVYDGTCSNNDIPAFTNLTETAFFEDTMLEQTRLTGPALSLGKMLAHGVVSTVAGSETASADLVSVFDAVLGFQSNSTASCVSVGYLEDPVRAYQSSLVNVAATATPPFLPTTSEDIESWINFFRASSDLETQQVVNLLTGAPRFAADLIPFFFPGELPTDTLRIFAKMIENKINDIPVALVNNLNDLDSAINFTTAPNIMALIGASMSSNNNFQRTMGFALSSLNLRPDARSILSLFMGLNSGDLTLQNVENLISHALPDIDASAIVSFVDLLNAIGNGLRSGIQSQVELAQAGAFWLLSAASSLYPSISL